MSRGAERLKKSGTFVSRKSAPPMEEKIERERRGGEKGKEGEEMLHFSHPQHPLVEHISPYIFICMGCKEYGAGRRFRCHTCNFDLHHFCALAPPSLQPHSLHKHHQLLFYTKPGGVLQSKCDICSKGIKGYAFHCTSCYFGMHPSCAKLEGEMEFPSHPHPLTLLPPTASKGGEHGPPLCSECQRRRSGRVYNCRICSYQLHAVCAKDMVNDLYAYGFRTPENKKHSMLWAAARVASSAIVGFLGGLIEGLGEGVGEAIISNRSKGKGSRIRKRKTMPPNY